MQFLLLFLAISVKQDTRLRSGCAPDEDARATLAAGTSVTIRYALSGESTPCYKVAAEVNGKTVEGYLSAAEIDGLDGFEQARRTAAKLDMNQVVSAIHASTPAASLGPELPAGFSGDVMRLIESGQPAKALVMLDPVLKKRKDPGALALAGVAAWRTDDLRAALEYWRASLALSPNADLEALIRRVEREAKSDQSGDKLAGMRVTLRYDGVAIKTEAAREMLAALDEDYFRISQQLGCVAEEKITAIVQTDDAYRKATNAAEWSGGQFDGKIRVPVLNGQKLDATTRRTFAHETVHACLAMLGRWPAWLHEGLAQKYSGDALSPTVRQKIATMIHDHQLPRLESIEQNWSRLDAEHARLAYGLALAAVEALAADANTLSSLLRNPDRLPAVTAELDKRLGF